MSSQQGSLTAESQAGGGERLEMLFALACGAMMTTGWLISMGSADPWVPRAFYVVAYGLGGFFALGETWRSLRRRRFDIDFLMIAAAVGAAFLDKWAEGALLLFLFSLGNGLEHYAMGRARRAIEALAALAPESANVRRPGGIEVVPLAALVRGDIVVVKPNERMPADGFVVDGVSSVDEAPITGESQPVDKEPVADASSALQQGDKLAAEHRIFSGTINQSGLLEVMVSRPSAESTLARVIDMVREAETQKSSTQRFAESFEHRFVPAVLALVSLLMFAWVVLDEPFSASFYRAIAVLVAASPCALAISTPSAVLSGVARGARGGVLFKGGGPLESLGDLDAMAFDKTGTLTEGKPRLTDVVPWEGASADQLLRAAIAIEALSDHPLASAVVRDGRDRLAAADGPTLAIVEATELRSITGRGVTAMIEGERVYAGKGALFDEVEGPPMSDALLERLAALEAAGRTAIVVRRGERYLGLLGLMDTPRQAAAETIRRLRQLGIERMIMLSGDNQQVVDAVAREVGLDEARGDLMPEDKVKAIQELRQKGSVAMVGDGVNDAPALAHATVGVAMGAAGSDVALETADIALMADELGHLPFAVGLSRQTRRIIRQNIWISLGMIAFLVPATLFGLRMGAAVLLHEGSTVVVVFNALRLLGYGGPKPDAEETSQIPSADVP